MAYQGTIRLFFSNNGKPSLEKVHFRYDEELGDIVSIRGRTQTSAQTYNSFLWSPAVRALSVLLLKTKSASQEGSALEGEEGSLASSLDYALGKSTTWLSDMFGYDKNGNPYSKKLLLRSNPERKRPGPVVISVNSQVLKPYDISIVVDGEEIDKEQDITALIDLIEQHASLKKGGPGEFKLKTILDETSLAMPAKLPAKTKNEISAYVNNHIFSTTLDVEKKFLRCLRERVIDRKFGFLSSQGVTAWQALCDSTEYPHFQDDLQLISNSLPEIVEHMNSPCQVIAVWPGTATKERKFYDAVKSKVPATFSMVDLSQEMLTNIFNEHPDWTSEVECYVADFMEPEMLSNICERIRKNDQPNILTFFGNTMGAHPQSEFLQTVRSALKPQDFVLFGIQASPEVEIKAENELERLTAQYENPNFSKLDLSNLEMCGIDISDGVVEIEKSNSPLIRHV